MSQHRFPRTDHHLGRRGRRLTGALISALLVGSAMAVPLSADATVPSPTAEQAVLTVKVGGDRGANGQVQGLAGVRLGLHAEGTGNRGDESATPQVAAQGATGARWNTAWTWTSCVSDAEGDCSFVIPVRSGAISATGVPQDTRFWVVQESVPTGWYTNPTARLGSFAATPEYSWQYRFRTSAELRGGVTYRSTDALAPLASWPAETGTEPDRGFMRTRPDSNAEGWMAGNVGRTTGVWSQSRTNPTLAPGCDLDVAVIADTSGSLGASGMAQVRSTLDTFVDAFRGTKTQMSLFSFSNASPGSGASNHPSLLPVTTGAQAAVVRAQYSGWVSGGGTNWDAGFRAAADSGNTYDLVVLLTDGNPTVYGSATTGNSAFNSFQDLDAGIFSANRLKAAGSRVVALGVGSAANSTPTGANLRAVSGTQADTDYHQTDDFAAAADVLSQLAKANCGGSIEVQKMIVPTGGTLGQAVPAPAGWEFSATTSAPGVGLVAPATASTTAPSNGTVGFGLTFATPNSSGPVQVLETQQAGWELVPVGTGGAARNAQCVNTETGTSVPVVDAGTAATPGFSAVAIPGVQVRCTVYNTRIPAPGVLVVEKSATPASGTAVTPGQVIDYTLTFRNTGGQPVSVDHTDHLAGVFDDADLVTGPTASHPDLTVTTLSGPPRFRVVGTVGAGEVRHVTYRVRVGEPDQNSGDGQMDNFVTPTGTPPPEVCESSSALCTTHPVPGTVSVSKTATGFTAPLAPGDEVTYSLTFTHAGGQPAEVDYSDSLADVLDDATWVAGPTVSAPGLSASLSGTAPQQTLRIQGSVSRGTPVTVSYRVRVKDSGLGNATLGNCAVQAAPGTDRDCTSTDVPGALSVAKTADPASGTPVVPGQEIHYTLTFRNTGGKPMAVRHTDDLAALLDDASITTAPTVTGGLDVTPMTSGSTSFEITGTLNGGATATVTYTATVKPPGAGDGELRNHLVVTGQTPPTTCVPAPGELPTCTTHPVPGDLSVAKTADPASTTPVAPGQVITYTLTFANGGGSGSSVDHTDHWADVLDDAELVAGSLTAQSGLSATVSGDGTSLRVVGVVPAGASRTVTYRVKVRTADFGNGRLTNVVRETGTVPPTTCIPTDRLCTTHPVPGELTVLKDSQPEAFQPVRPGEVITYSLTFTNRGGMGVQIDHVDHLGDVLDDAIIVSQPEASSASVTVTPTPLGTAREFRIRGPLAAGERVTVSYAVRVKASGFGNGNVLNTVVPRGEEPPTICEPPLDPVEGEVREPRDPRCTAHPVPGNLTVTKSSDPTSGTPVAPGDVVSYTLTFRNTGGSPVSVEHTDHMEGVLDDAVLVANPLSSVPAMLGVRWAPGDASFDVTGTLARESTVTVTYRVRVRPAADREGDGVLGNVLVRTGEQPPGVCRPTDQMCTEHPVPGRLAVTKTADPVSGSVVRVGQQITYRLTFRNTGRQPVRVDHTDHLGGVLDDAELTSGPAVAGDSFGLDVTSVTDQRFRVSGSLEAGRSVVVEYRVRVTATPVGDKVLLNHLVPGSGRPPAQCVTGNQLCTEHPVGEFSVTKTADPTSGTTVREGDTVTYTLTFRNSGALPHRVTYTDHMVDVLDDGLLVSRPAVVGAPHGLQVQAMRHDRFGVSGTMEPRSQVVVSYRVLVHTTGRGNGVLVNWLAPRGEVPQGPCAGNSTLCTTHPVREAGAPPESPSTWLPSTGGPGLWGLVVGLIAVLTGGLVLGARRLRRPDGR